MQNSTTRVPILGGRTIFRIYRTSPVQRNAGHPFFLRENTQKVKGTQVKSNESVSATCLAMEAPSVVTLTTRQLLCSPHCTS